MKKNSIVFLGIVFPIVVIAVIAVIISNNKNISNNNEIANLINDNSNLPVEYMSKYDKNNANLQEYEYLNNYMSDDYQNYDISFSYYGYPNDESDYYLGRISVISNKYNILGITKGDNMKEAISKIEKYGFKLEDNNNYYEVTLKNKDFSIILYSDSENFEENDDIIVVDSIQVNADSEYLGNRMY